MLFFACCYLLYFRNCESATLTLMCTYAPVLLDSDSEENVFFISVMNNYMLLDLTLCFSHHSNHDGSVFGENLGLKICVLRLK